MKRNLTAGTRSLLGGRYVLSEFNIGDEPAAHLTSPAPIMEVGGRPQVESLFAGEIQQFHEQVGSAYVRLPYSFLCSAPEGKAFGDFAPGREGCSFDDIRFRLTAEPFHPDTEMYDLWRLCQLLQPDKIFTSLEYCMFVRGLQALPDGLELTIGPGLYTEAAFTVNSDGLVIGLSETRRGLLGQKLSADKFATMEALLAQFIGRYGENQTVRAIVHKKLGRMPNLDEAYSYIMGGAALVLTSDEKLIFTRRSPGTTLVNHGINIPTSGGAVFNEKSLRELGLPRYLQFEMLREAAEELNIWGEDIRTVAPLGIVRELARGCTADGLYLIRYRGTLEKAVGAIAANTHPSRSEIDQMLYAMSVEDARRLVRDPQAEKVLHHKALVALILADRAGYLS